MDRNHSLDPFINNDLETGADETSFTFVSGMVGPTTTSTKKKLVRSLIKSSKNDEEAGLKYLDDDRVGYDDDTLTDDSSRFLISNNDNKQSYGGTLDSNGEVNSVIHLTAKVNGLGRRRLLHRRTFNGNTTKKIKSKKT